MERLNVGVAVSALFLIFALGCAVDQEKQGQPEKKEATEEEKAIEFLKNKGAELVWHVNGTERSLHFVFFKRDLCDADLEHLKKLKGLEAVSLQGTITDEGLATLAKLNQLKYVFIAGADISDRGIDKLAGVKSLEHLTLNGMKITGHAFKRFGGLPRLKALKLSLPFTDEALNGLDALTQLEKLDLSYTKVTDEGLRSLKGLKRLEHLNLNETPVTDAGMADLAGLPSLKKLELSKTKVGDEGAKALARSKSITDLRLDATAVGDQGLAHLSALKNLTRLSLVGTPISDEGLKHLHKTKLAELWIFPFRGELLTDKGLRYLQDVKTLRSLHMHLSRTNATAAGLQQLQNARPDMKVFAQPKE